MYKLLHHNHLYLFLNRPWVFVLQTWIWKRGLEVKASVDDERVRKPKKRFAQASGATASLRSAVFKIFPVALRGSEGKKTILRGTL